MPRDEGEGEDEEPKKWVWSSFFELTVAESSILESADLI